MHLKKIAATVLVAALVSTPISSVELPSISAEEVALTDLSNCSIQLSAAGPFDPATDFTGIVSVVDANGAVLDCGQYTVSWNTDSEAGVAIITAEAVEGGSYVGSVQCTAALIAAAQEPQEETPVVPEEPAPEVQDPVSPEPENSENTKPDDPAKEEASSEQKETVSSQQDDKDSASVDSDNETVKDASDKQETVSKPDTSVANKEDTAESEKSILSLEYPELVHPAKIIKDFRFWTVAAKYSFTNKETYVYEEPSDEAKKVGEMDKHAILYMLKDENDDWLYIESGKVRGFIQKADLVNGKEAEKIYQETALGALVNVFKKDTVKIPKAKALVSAEENAAYTYLRATAKKVVIEKKYAIAKEDIDILEDKDEKAKVVGTLKKNGYSFIVKKCGKDWLYIESGDVRGFVEKDKLNYSKDVQEHAPEYEYRAAFAEETVKPEENSALYYSLKSVKTGVPSGSQRKSVLEYASQFIGNPYVWGGTSLLNGCDCSGFVQQIYKEYGINLPRVSSAQAMFGQKIPVADAVPGDLIFYANDAGVYHVVIYAGEGRTIEAQCEETGIVNGRLDLGEAKWATRILDDSAVATEGSISDQNARDEMYGDSLGEFEITYYCACEKCCGAYANGITSTGEPVVEGQTIAVDPSVIPYGTKVIIGGHVFTAQDCGGAIKGNHIDVYVSDHDRALQYGRDTAEVFTVKEAEE